jgi:tRNA threonylcarbamoyladenosine biosynthesis protein TsaB
VSYYLALDTATEYCTVAVGGPGEPIAELSVSDRRHATALMPAIEEVNRLAGLTYSDLSGILLGDGPGSFTGLRIGFATVKGILSQRDDLTLHVIPSLLATAWPFRKFTAGPIVALYDALRGEVFAAVYRLSEDRVVTEQAPVLTTVTQLTELEDVVPSLAVGSGALIDANLVANWTGCSPIGLPAAAPRAAALLEMLTVEGAAELVGHPEGREPCYGRLAEAQVRWEQTHGRELDANVAKQGRKAK